MVINIFKKIFISIFIIGAICLISLPNKSHVYALENNNVENVSTIRIPAMQKRYFLKFDADTYKPGNQKSTTNTGKLGDVGNSIVKIIRNIGSALSVIVLMILAIKYMMGSVEEKAEYKKTMFPYVIGCVMVFGITNILSIIADIIV